jgi:hypothetical protein
MAYPLKYQYQSVGVEDVLLGSGLGKERLDFASVLCDLQLKHVVHNSMSGGRRSTKYSLSLFGHHVRVSMK